MIALLILAFNLNLVFSEALNATDAVGNDDLLSMVASTITVYCDINTPKVSALKQTQKLQSTIWDSPTIPPVSMQRYLTRYVFSYLILNAKC